MDVGGGDELALSIANDGERDFGGFEKPLHVLGFFIDADGDRVFLARPYRRWQAGIAGRVLSRNGTSGGDGVAG